MIDFGAVGEQFSSAISDISDNVSSMADDVRESVDNAMDNARSFADNAMDDANSMMDDVRTRADSAMNDARTMADGAMSSVRDAGDNLRQQGENALTNFRSRGFGGGGLAAESSPYDDLLAPVPDLSTLTKGASGFSNEMEGAIAHRLKAMGATVGAYKNATFAEVQQQLDRLPDLLETAIRRDQREAEGLLIRIARAFKHGFGYGGAKDRFEAEATAIQMVARSNLTMIQALVAAEMAPHQEVPDLLEGNALKWTEEGKTVGLLGAQALKLMKIPGWQGASAVQYQTAGKVQLSAMKELGGVVAAAASSCATGGLFNRALFYIGQVEIQKGADAIRSFNFGSGRYWRRTSHAANTFAWIIDRLGPVVKGEYVAQSANDLISEMAATVGMGNHIQPGRWPTGTEGADVPAANTESGVQSSGETTTYTPTAVDADNRSVKV